MLKTLQASPNFQYPKNTKQTKTKQNQIKQNSGKISHFYGRNILRYGKAFQILHGTPQTYFECPS